MTVLKNLFLVLFVISGIIFTYKFGRIQDFSIKIDENTIPDEEIFQLEVALQKKLKIFKGRWVWTVSLKEIFAHIQANDYGDKLRVTRIFPNRIVVHLDSGSAILTYLRSDSKLQSVFLNGTLSKPYFSSKYKGLPILRGKLFLKNQDLRLRAISFVNRLKKKGYFSQENVSEVFTTLLKIVFTSSCWLDIK